MDNSLIIVMVILTVVVIAILLVCCFRYIKKKIRNKIIDKGADIITKATGKYLDEKMANKVNIVTNVTAETLKNGNVTTTVAKKGFEIARQEFNRLNKDG